jgi:hypothetical protein
MLSKIIMAVVFAVLAYLACVFVGTLLIALNVAVAVAVGSFLKEFAGLVSVLVFLYCAFVGTVNLRDR